MRSDDSGPLVRSAYISCALTALILLVCELCGAMPAWAVTLKYMGTVAVTVTLCTDTLSEVETFHRFSPVVRTAVRLRDAALRAVSPYTRNNADDLMGGSLTQ